MDALLDYLDDIEEVLETSKSMPFSSRISVEKARILDVLNEIRLNLPDDIRQAQRILNDHDKIIKDAEHKAQDIIDRAEEDVKLMVSNHELFRRASEQAHDLLEDAKKEARELRAGASSYVDAKLEDAEKHLKEFANTLDTQTKEIKNYFISLCDVLYENRQEMRKM